MRPPGPGAVLAMGIAALVVAVLVVRTRGDGAAAIGPAGPAPPTVTSLAPTVLSAAGLRERAATLGQPVYWAGPTGNARYELSRDRDSATVRYLPSIGNGNAVVTVRTQVFPDALERTKALGRTRGAVSANSLSGGVAVYFRSRPTHVFVATPESLVRVEIVDPTPGEAKQIVSSGLLQRVR